MPDQLVPPTRLPRRTRRSARVAGLALAAVLAAPAAAVAAPDDAAAPRTTPDLTPTTLAWFDTTSDALRVANLGSTGTTQITATRLWATAWTAADEAVASVSLPSRHPRGPGATAKGRPRPATAGEAQQAALATAVHDVLLNAVPAQQATNDAALAKTLAGIPAGPARDAGVAAGRRAAAKWIAARTGDGLDQASVNAPFTPPPPGLGVWQPTLPDFAPAVLSAQGKGRPFVLPRVAERFPAPPPARPGSRRAIADLRESERLGGVDSTARTPRQTAVAKFWSQSSISGFTSVLRAVVADDRRGLADQVHLVSVFHRVTADAQIAVYGQKYKYLYWRPVTALRFDDRNPATPQDANFVPLITTPAHPEYPSGHVGYAAAAEGVFRRLVGPAPTKPVTATSTATPTAPITYASWRQITQDNVDARVWSGIHFRSTDEATRGYAAGIAQAALARLRGPGGR